MNQIEQRTTLFFNTLATDYTVVTYSNPLQTWSQGDVIVPYNLNRVVLAFTGGSMSAGDIGIVTDDGNLLPMPVTNVGNGMYLVLSLHQALVSREYRAMQNLASDLTCYGVVRRTLGR